MSRPASAASEPLSNRLVKSSRNRAGKVIFGFSTKNLSVSAEASIIPPPSAGGNQHGILSAEEGGRNAMGTALSGMDFKIEAEERGCVQKHHIHQSFTMKSCSQSSGEAVETQAGNKSASCLTPFNTAQSSPPLGPAGLQPDLDSFAETCGLLFSFGFR